MLARLHRRIVPIATACLVPLGAAAFAGCLFSLADVRPVGDAGPDGPVSAWCASQPHQMFCDDFDEDAGLLSLWSRVDSDGGVVMLDDEQWKSPPSALHTVAPSGAGCTGTAAGLVKLFPSPFSEADLAFDFYDDGVVGLAASMSLGNYFLGLGIAGKSSYLQQSAGNTTHNEGFQVDTPARKWVRVELHVAFATDRRSGTIQVSLDGTPASFSPNGTPVQSLPVSSDLIGAAIGHAPQIEIGDHCNNTTSTRHLYYDNVTFNAD